MKRFILSFVLFAFIGISNSFAQNCKLTVAESISASDQSGTYINASCDVESFSISIMNRRGEVLYKSSDVKAFWNFNEKEAGSAGFKFEQGIYKYKVDYKFKGDATSKSHSGNITLIR